MHKTVLIILAAVVALIVIVVLTGMRYLRADDEDDFDGDVAAEGGHSRGRGEHPARGHSRSGHHDDRRAEGRARAERDGAGRVNSRESAAGQRSDRAMLAGAGASRRDGADRARAIRDSAGLDGGVRPGDRRGPARDVAPGRGRDDPGRDDRRNSGPQRRVTAPRDFDRSRPDELISASAASGHGSAGRGGMRADDLDDRTARLSARDSGRSSGSREIPSRDIGGPSRDDRARDDRERRGNSGQNARPDSRRTTTSQVRKDDSLPDVKPRPSKTSQSKSKRDDDGDWPSTEWDELSDVDYWAELASDKPFTSGAASTTTQGRPDRDRADARSAADSGPTRAVDRRDSPDRRDSRDSLERRDSSAGMDRRDSERRDSAERRDQLLPAARASRQTVDAAFAPPPSNGTDAYGSTELRRAIASGRTSTSGPHRMPQPADDDPLTSPSFPRISSDDSRSYRRSSGRGPGESQSQTRPHPTYPPAPPAALPPAPLHPPVGPLDSQPGMSRTSGGYNQPVANGYPAPAPAAPAASYLPPAGNGYAPDSVTNAYSTPAPAAPGYSTMPPNGYQPESATYQAPLGGPSSAAFSAEHDNGYGAVAPAVNGYSALPAAGYPTQSGDQQGYSGYPGLGQSQAAQPQATGFSYSPAADPGFSGQLPPAQQSGSYVGYQAPANPGEAGVYQMPPSGMLPPQAVQPGYPGAPYSPAPYNAAPYSAAPYEQPGYPAPTRAYDADGAYPADPYAVDPYGYPGYGSARLPDQRWRGLLLSEQRWDERSGQEQSTDDRPGTARHGCQQYWEDDDR